MMETIYVMDSSEEEEMATESSVNKRQKILLGKRKDSTETNQEENYRRYLKLSQDCSLIPTTEVFTCSICLEQVAEGQGVLLKSCIHQFCRSCLKSVIQISTEPQITCPYSDANYTCPYFLQVY